MKAMVYALALLGMALGTSGQAETVIRTSRLWDPVEGVLIDRDIHVDNGRIIKVTPRGKDKADIDLTGLTVLPGLIDTHSHIAAHFDDDGKIVFPDGAGNETPQQAAMRAAANAWATVRGGITTVQSPGERLDAPLRDLINGGALPGPRILTSIGRITEATGTPDQIRAEIRRLKGEGADFVKLFATSSGRDAPRQTLSDAAIVAGCREAAALGLRAIVHAHLSNAAIVASDAGCTAIEHGGGLTPEVFAVLARNGTYYDPNFLVSRNYLDNKARFLGTGNYTEESFVKMAQNEQRTTALMKAAMAAGVAIVMGTDAVAGAHGGNARELVYRVQLAGQSPEDALKSATSVAARSLRLDSEIGRIAPGFSADLIATTGDPTRTISDLLKMEFVMARGVRMR